MRRLARLALALIVLLGVLFIAGFPVRTYLDQRRALAATTDRLEVLRDSNKALTARADELHSDAAVERLAREQYNLVRPGEEAYAILPGPEAPVVPKAVVPRSKPGFWSRLWDDVTFWSD